jgi:NAD(P)-dependent dehydrogenase (short-subunit alcohol dehydrogenase family)
MSIRPKPDQDQFKGKTAVVTGAGSGIGRSMALLLAQLGATVHVADIDGAAAIETAGTINNSGGKAAGHTLDVTDAEAVAAFAEDVFAADGRVDILHNNAGIGHGGAVVDTPLEDWHKVLNVNLFGVINGLNAFAPRMVEQGGESHIVNTASMAGLTASAGMAPYCTSKFGVVGMSLALDAELKSKGIRVTALCPGIIDTAIVKESTMRGAIEGRHDKLTDFYKKRGASPDVVARDAVVAIVKKQVIKPSPWWQVSPGWWLMRVSPRAYTALARRTYKSIIGG